MQLDSIRFLCELLVVRDLVAPHRERTIGRQLEPEMCRRRRHPALRRNEAAEHQRDTDNDADGSCAHNTPLSAAIAYSWERAVGRLKLDL
jgi:hypothetical protein